MSKSPAPRLARAPRVAKSKRLRSRIEICILAGGQSARMGQDKARLRLKGHTMLSIVRTIAKKTRYGVRVIRDDAVPCCGPLGGILTGLRSTKAEAVLFLACDMPLITVGLLRKIVCVSGTDFRATFGSQLDRIGFPMLLPIKATDAVEEQINSGRLSIRELAAKLRARKLRVGARTRQLFNVNSPQDVRVASQLLGRATKTSSAAGLRRPPDSRRN